MNNKRFIDNSLFRFLVVILIPLVVLLFIHFKAGSYYESVFILFFPPVMGVADDGSLSKIMYASGLGYRGEDLESPVGAYFTRLYLHSTQQDSGGFSTHRILRARYPV